MDDKKKILVVEDEAAIRSGLIDVFVYHGYHVDSAAEGKQGLQMALSGRFDLVLLDLMLPGINGFEICERLRATDRDQAIIMLTARSGDEDVIEGLRLGADDYIAKPFSVTELVLRVEAVLRRTQPTSNRPDTIEFGTDTHVDLLNLSGRRGSEKLVFTRREIDLLRYLHDHQDRPVSREELLHKVWGYARNLGLETRTVDIHIAKLRRKIEARPATPVCLVTVRGAGYRLQCGEASDDTAG